MHLGVDSPGLTVEQNVSNDKLIRRMLTDGNGAGIKRRSSISSDSVKGNNLGNNLGSARIGATHY
jgi:hypothetical protein